MCGHKSLRAPWFSVANKPFTCERVCCCVYVWLGSRNKLRSPTHTHTQVKRSYSLLSGATETSIQYRTRGTHTHTCCPPPIKHPIPPRCAVFVRPTCRLFRQHTHQPHTNSCCMHISRIWSVFIAILSTAKYHCERHCGYRAIYARTLLIHIRTRRSCRAHYIHYTRTGCGSDDGGGDGAGECDVQKPTIVKCVSGGPGCPERRRSARIAQTTAVCPSSADTERTFGRAFACTFTEQTHTYTHNTPIHTDAHTHSASLAGCHPRELVYVGAHAMSLAAYTRMYT